MSVSEKAVSGAAWNLSTGIGVRALGLVGTLILTRFISPTDYGEVSAALVLVLTASRSFNLNLGSYVIAYNTEPGVTFQAGLVQLIGVLVSCGAVLGLQGPLGTLVGAPGLGRYLPGLALAMILNQGAVVPSATLAREFHFRIVAISRASGEVAFTLTSLALAPWIGGPALVVGSVVRSALVYALIVARSDRSAWWAPCRPQWNTAKSFLHFGLPMAGRSLAENASATWDNLLVSRFFGPAVMGQYNLGYNLATTPSAHVAEHINDVLLPSYAAVETARRGPAVSRTVALMGLILFPLAFGLAVVSSTLIAVVMAPRWAGVAPMVAILAGISATRPIVLPIENYLQAERKPRLIFVLSLSKLLAMIALVVLAAPRGPEAACMAVLLAFVLHAALCLLAVGWQGEGDIALAALRGAIPPFIAATLMAGTVAGVGSLLTRVGGLPLWGVLLVECAAGALAYTGYAWLVARPLTREAVVLLGSLIRRKAAGGAVAPQDAAAGGQ